MFKINYNLTKLTKLTHWLARKVTHVVNDQLLLLVLPSQLADKHLDEVLEGGGHIHVLGLQLDAGALLLHLLHQPAHRDGT